MDECELVSFITAVACVIAKSCPEDEITLLATIFSQLGDTLATILTKRSLAETDNEKASSTNGNIVDKC